MNLNKLLSKTNGFLNVFNKNRISAATSRCYCQPVVKVQNNKQFKYKNDEIIEQVIEKYEDKILYNCVIEQQKVKLGFRRNKIHEQKQTAEYQKHLFNVASVEPLPASLKYLYNNHVTQSGDNNLEDLKDNHNLVTQFPFEKADKIKIEDNNSRHLTNEEFNSPRNEILHRNIHFSDQNESNNWMSDYENYDDSIKQWTANYGTPDRKSAVSNVPCGGCGALLHCKDTAIPGYLPSEIFKSHQLFGGQKLETLICQRCHFLKNYNMALQVRVSPEDYPKILEKIQENKHALVVLMVDLLDFPCSIWPGIMDIIGYKKPVIVLGNKVDLLPPDCRGYLERVRINLEDCILKSGFNPKNIKHVGLISAKTGYGVEELITKLHNIWKYNGDVYIIGCTNVGKSTLFNALLQSDYCKIKAVDLVQRATTSLWPGTTLNLLKFPILRPSGWRLFVRTKRLMSLNKLKSQENRLRKIQLKSTQNPKYATLIGHIERTFTNDEPLDEAKSDMFSVHASGNTSGKVKIGINEQKPEYKLSKWCYDTPGVVQPDQILHLLTTEELMLTLPKSLIHPRTFSIKPGLTVFLAGLGRLDVVDGPATLRVTIFSSNNLPVTICSTTDADNLYEELVGSQLFQVPVGTEERLKKWPKLVAGNDIHLTGVDWEISCADILLSSAGWISVTLGPDVKCTLIGWTPERRGIYIRDSLLSKAVTLRGQKIRRSPAYKKSRFFA